MTQPPTPRGEPCNFPLSDKKNLPKGRASSAPRGQGWKLLRGTSPPWCPASTLDHVPRHQGAGAEMQQVDALGACIPPAPSGSIPASPRGLLPLLHRFCTFRPQNPFGGVWPLTGFIQTQDLSGTRSSSVPPAPRSLLCAPAFYFHSRAKVSLYYSLARR